jgi:hypothetical protein
MARSNMLLRSTSLLALLGAGLASGCTLETDNPEMAFAGLGESGDGGGEDGGEEGGVGEAVNSGFGDGDGDGENNHDEGQCAEVSATVEQIAPTVILLLDQSGSMSADFGQTSRWNAMVDSLLNEDTGLVPMNEDKVNFGLSLYTSHGGFEGGQCPILNEVGAAQYAFTAIDDVLSNASPDGDTPTGESLAAVAEQLANDSSIEGEKIIILATDGEPDTCDQPNPQLGQGLAVAAAEAAFDSGIETRVISVGDDVGASHLQDMANAGRGLSIDGPDNATYYQALDAEALAGAFDDIIADAVSCTFSVEGSVDLTQACSGEVVLDGQALDCGNEWEMVDESTLELVGEACATLKDGQNHTVEASWTCGVYIP